MPQNKSEWNSVNVCNGQQGQKVVYCATAHWAAQSKHHIYFLAFDSASFCPLLVPVHTSFKSCKDFQKSVCMLLLLGYEPEFLIGVIIPHSGGLSKEYKCTKNSREVLKT